METNDENMDISFVDYQRPMISLRKESLINFYGRIWLVIISRPNKKLITYIIYLIRVLFKV